MSAPAPCLSLLVLTEDSAQDAHDTLVALAKKMLQLLVPSCRTHLVDFHPANEEARRAVQGTAWKIKPPATQRQRVELVRTIANKLSEKEATGFVLFHIDGDRPWSEREASENRRQFEERIVSRVEQLLPPDAREGSMKRLLLVMPFYSIEAWLYQNTQAAIRICHERYGGAHVDRFAAWRERRATLDELSQPKKEVCLHDRHNLELAREGFSPEEVYEAGASFTAAVDALLAAEDLLRAVEQTCT